MTISRSDRTLFQTHAISPSSSRSFRILFLAPFAPHLQASHGGGRVIAQLIAQLVQRHSIGLCYLRTSKEPAVDDVVRERCEVVEEILIPEPEGAGPNRWIHRVRVWKELLMGRPLWAIDRFSPFYGERLKMLLETWQPDIVQIEFHIMGQYLSAIGEYAGPRILVQHEPGAESARELIGPPFSQGRIIPQLDLFAWKRFERNVIRQVQAVVVFTERDRKTVSRLGLQTPIVQIPLGTELPECALQENQDEPLSLLFVGNFKHLPNVDAANRLINRIFPRVLAKFPETRLFIVGDHLPTNMVGKSNENVILTGYVPDVKPYLNQATLIIVPLSLGGGMRVKILEALAAGKPVVASSRAIEGLDLVNGEQVVLAESDDEFSQAICNLLDHLEKRTSLASQARAWASINLNWERTAEAYEILYRNLLKC